MLQANQRSVNKNDIVLSMVLLIVFMVGLLFMPREEYPADPMAVRCETISLLNTGSLAVPAALAVSFGERGQFFVENTSKQQWFCKYGILNSLMYMPALLIQKWHEGTLDYLSHSRVLYLNIFNILLSLASAFYLYRIASRYTQQDFIRLFFVLAAFYTTYWWNYLRAHNSEVYQTLFMLGFYYHLVRASDNTLPKSKKYQQGFLGGLFFSLLILVKMVYVVLLPLIGCFFLAATWRQWNQKKSFKGKMKESLPLLFCFGLPVVFAMSLLLWVNNYKFGSPFESGYGQWKERGKPIFSGNIFSGLHGFLLNKQYSVFICFPVFTFSLIGYPAFFKRYRLEMLLVIVMGATLLFINAKFLAWSGGWAYGPRYLLVILPLVSLPFIATIELLLQNRKKIWAFSLSVLIAGALLLSFYLQTNVNALPFFVPFQLQGVFSQLHDPECDAYFANTPFGIINGDLLTFKKGGSFPPMMRAAKELFPEKLAELTKIVQLQCRSNYYFFPHK